MFVVGLKFREKGAVFQRKNNQRIKTKKPWLNEKRALGIFPPSSFCCQSWINVFFFIALIQSGRSNCELMTLWNCSCICEGIFLCVFLCCIFWSYRNLQSRKTSFGWWLTQDSVIISHWLLTDYLQDRGTCIAWRTFFSPLQCYFSMTFFCLALKHWSCTPSSDFVQIGECVWR